MIADSVEETPLNVEDDKVVDNLAEINNDTPLPNVGDTVALENAESREDATGFNVENAFLENTEIEEDTTLNAENKKETPPGDAEDETALELVENKEDATAENVVENALENVEIKDAQGIVVEDEESFRTSSDQEEEEVEEDQLEDEDEENDDDNEDKNKSKGNQDEAINKVSFDEQHQQNHTCLRRITPKSIATLVKK